MAVALLAAAVAVVLLGHGRIRPATGIAVLVAVGVLSGGVEPGRAGEALQRIDGALAFLVFAVPLAVSLDRLGFFDAVAAKVRAGPRLEPSLWVLAAAVTALFNLDASIVLLTPLYLRIAQRHGLQPLRLAFQPVLLASLASSVLPASNLTNLIAAERGLRVGGFLTHLGPASVAASAVGWFAFRRLRLGPAAAPIAPTAAGAADPPGVGDPPGAVDPPGAAAAGDRRAIPIGMGVVVVLAAGFTFGDAWGVPAWLVAATVGAALMGWTRRVPWRTVPLEAIVVAAGLAVLTDAAAPSLGLARFFAGSGPAAEVRIAASAVVASVALNNLPALLVALPHVEGASVWPLLIGVNLGPALWVSGSLAGLLWLDIVRQHGLHVGPLDYARVGLRVGIPALLVAVPLVLLSLR